MQKIKKALIISVIAAVVILLMVMHYDSKKMLVFRDSLDKTVVTVDGKELTLKEVAFYVADEETTIEEQAYIYDEIFYELAQKEGLTRSSEEEEMLNNKEMDFWSDLTDEQKESLGVSEEQIMETMRHLALAEKYQNSLVEQDGNDSYDSYSISGEKYQEILKDHTFKVKERVWDKIDFGNIVVGHEE